MASEGSTICSHRQDHSRCEVNGADPGGRFSRSAEHPRRPLQQLRLPLRDLVRINVKLLRQLGQRLVALQGRRRHLWRSLCSYVSVSSRKASASVAVRLGSSSMIT